MNRKPIGDLLDALGVQAKVDEGELVASAVVLLKVIDAAGDTALRCAWSEGLDWVTRLGMVTAAQAAEQPTSEDLRGS